MGALANLGAGVGQSVMGGSVDAAALARQSLGWGTLATGANVAANIATGVGGYEQGRYAAKVAGANETNDLLAGSYAESVSKGRTTRLVSEQKAAQAANGIQVTSKTAEAVRAATQSVGDMDAAVIHYNAMREAFGQAQERTLAEKTAQGALSRGLAGAGASFLSGASSLGSKWALYKQTGAI